ncbi:hypothetical protein G7Z17_g9066 [Cylindrodendrum hubeiense]|uniref:Micro-fibrillar-associated protein 1 C-terminal domain-containing protein n=1 Tax=Cylindrodendrum hubeiense TaxID=595255 RepID=A0A9P5H8J3_9HYPO|nr:hypothetical protein G7Z17_g9066 [Cylindrodendrum hubeiense]
MGTRIADDVRNREALPEYLQRRDMAKLGRKGGTKYRDMRSEDTGRWGDSNDRPRKGGRFDGDERFQPDDDRFKSDERGAKGANAIPLGDRRDDHRKDDRRDREDRRESHRRNDDDGHRRRKSGSRSRSPRHDSDRDDNRSRRKRSTSREGDRYDSDKRRKVDA